MLVFSQVKQARELYILGRSHLWPLTKVLQHCTSDDETDVDATPQARKVVKIRKFRWRNPQLETIFVAIDEARDRRRDIRLPTGAPPAIRERGLDNPYNEAEIPHGLSVDCYCPNFLRGLGAGVAELEIDPRPILGPLIDLCNQGQL